MKERKRMFWKEYKLQYESKNTGFSVEKDNQGLFRVKWSDGVLSKDHYNLTWAKSHAETQYLLDNNTREKQAAA